MFGVIFDAVISVVLILLTIASFQQSSATHVARLAARTNCESSNQLRASLDSYLTQAVTQSLAFLASEKDKIPTTQIDIYNKEVALYQSELAEANANFAPQDCNKAGPTTATTKANP